jgi:hypothetical protein
MGGAVKGPEAVGASRWRSGALGGVRQQPHRAAAAYVDRSADGK